MPILVLKDGQQYGPYEPAEVQTYVNQGSFQLTDLCWQDGWSNWQPLSTVISRPPPAAPPQVPQTVAETSQTKRNTAQEEIIWEGRATLWKHAGSIIWSVVLSLLLGMFTMGIGLILAPIWWGAIYLERRQRKYTVTTKRVKAEFGLFAKSSTEIRIKDIRNVNIVRKGIAGMFGIGTLEFSSSGGSGIEVSFQAISNAAAVKKIVDELQD